MFKRTVAAFLAIFIGFVGMAESYQQATGSAAVSSSDADECIIAAPGAGKTLYVTDITVFISTMAVGNNGLVAVEDGVGGTRLAEMISSTNTVASPATFGYFHFDAPGFPLTSNTCLNLTTEGATTAAGARANGRANVGR